MIDAATEIARLRSDERFRECGNAIADTVIYDVMLADPIDNAVRSRVLQTSIDKFGDRISPDIIRQIVDRTIIKEVRDRERSAMAPRQKRR